MFEIVKEFRFEAGHSLTHHDGLCRYRHGHSYILQIHLHGSELHSNGPKKNMLVDFGDLKTLVDPMITEFFDHKWINDSLNEDSPTVEFIAQWIYKYLQPNLPQLCAVTIYETPTARVTYRLKDASTAASPNLAG